MSEGHWTDRVSDYLDGELEAADRAAAERHLASCADCAGALDELHALVRLAAAEDGGASLPGRDLWPGIRGRLTPRVAGTTVAADAGGVIPLARRRRVVLTIPQALAAGIALAVLSAGAGWLAVGSAPQDEPLAREETAIPMGTLMAAYEAPMLDLQGEYERRRGELDPETVRVVERSLALIDAAIADAREALEADPSSPFLQSHLAATMRRRTNLLRQVSSI